MRFSDELFSILRVLCFISMCASSIIVIYTIPQENTILYAQVQFIDEIEANTDNSIESSTQLNIISDAWKTESESDLKKEMHIKHFTDDIDAVPQDTVRVCPIQYHSPEVIPNLNQKWQTLTISKPNARSSRKLTIFLLNAYFDYIDNNTVHLFTLNTGYQDKNRTIYCQFSRHGMDESVAVQAKMIRLTRYQNSGRINKVQFNPYLYKCEIPRENTGLNFTHVSLVRKPCANVTNLVPITYAEKSNGFQHEFGVCVPIGYGNKSDADFVSLIEWFEFHRLLGVSKIHVYNGTLTVGSKIQRVFNYYVKNKLLEIIQMPPPMTNYIEKEAEGAGKMMTYAANNDCLYRNRYKHRFISMVDFDEIIIPSNASDYNGMILDLKKSSTINVDKNSLFFMSDNYFLEYAADETQPDILPSMRHREFASVPGFRMKSFHNPRICTRTNSHKCETHFHRFVSPRIGTVHHYRKTCQSHNNPQYWSEKRCSMLANKTHVNEQVLNFKPTLLENVKRAHIEINEN